VDVGASYGGGRGWPGWRGVGCCFLALHCGTPGVRCMVLRAARAWRWNHSSGRGQLSPPASPRGVLAAASSTCVEGVRRRAGCGLRPVAASAAMAGISVVGRLQQAGTRGTDVCEPPYHGGQQGGWPSNGSSASGLTRSPRATACQPGGLDIRALHPPPVVIRSKNGAVQQHGVPRPAVGVAASRAVRPGSGWRAVSGRGRKPWLASAASWR